MENFETGYFMEFHQCSDFSNEISIPFDFWQGTIKGCFSNNKLSRLDEGKECDDDETTLEKIPSQKIKSYKGITLCGKTKGNYYNLLFSDSVVGENEECPKGTKNCGYIDSVLINYA